MGWRGVAVLAAVCLVLAAVLIWGGRGRDEGLLPVRSWDLQAVTLVAHGETTVVSRGPGGWVVERPVRDLADSQTIASLLDEVGELRSVRSFEAEGPLAEYGLAPPAWSLEVAGRGGRRAVLWLGGETPVGSHRFASTSEGRTVVLVSSSAAERMENLGQGVRSRRLLQMAPEDVGEIHFEAPEVSFTALRKDGRWELQGALSCRAAEEEIRSFLHRVHEPVVKSFSPHRAGPPVGVWAFGGSRAETLMVFPPEAEAVVVASSLRPEAMAVDSGMASLLRGSPARWRARQVLSVSPYAARAVTVVRGADTLRVVRRETEWRVGEHLADGQLVSGLLRDLEWARVDTFLDRACDPAISVEVEGTEGSREVVGLSPEGDGVVVCSEGLGGVGLVRGLDVGRWTTEVGAWRSRRIVHVEPFQVDRVVVEVGGKRAEARRKGFQEWKTKGWAREVSPDSLISALCGARLVRFAGGGAAGEPRGAVVRVRAGDHEVVVELESREGEVVVRTSEGQVGVVEENVYRTVEGALAEEVLTGGTK